ncbi:MAG: hypothetical protein RMK94_12055 [Armatimonadota bacterium]|nr:hypothetical protein [Armatimonadota bacterium]
MRRSKALLISVWCFVAFVKFGLDRNLSSVLLAAPIPPDPSKGSNCRFGDSGSTMAQPADERNEASQNLPARANSACRRK